MTLFAGLYVGSSAVQQNQVALRVVGNNIANAGSENYVRQEISASPLPPMSYGQFSIGSGSRVSSVRQQIDRFLQERARQAGSDHAASDARATMLRRVETTFNELTDDDLSTQLSDFFNAIQDVANRPDDVSLRTIVTQRGAAAADTIRDLRGRLDDIRQDVSREVELAVDEINGTLRNIRELNVRIIEAESGTASDAGDLRVQRDQEIQRLSKLIDFTVYEQPTGGVNLVTNGDFLLFNGTIQEVGIREDSENGQVVKRLVFADSQFPLTTTGGRLGGAQDFRDNDLDQLIEKLDEISRGLIWEFNKIHSAGQGLRPIASLEGTNRTLDPTAALNSPAAALEFAPQNGSFEIRVTDQSTGQAKTHIITVDLDGLGADDSLNDVVNRINTVAFGGQAAASVNNQGRVEIAAPAGQSFSFAKDTSGFLAAMGINTFFKGSDSRNIEINEAVSADPALFAAAQSTDPADNKNALALATFQTRAFAALGGRTLNESYTGLVQELGSTSQTVSLEAQAKKNAHSALTAESQAISGVSLDEEAVKLMAYQRAFQASARYIQTINELLDELMLLGR